MENTAKTTSKLTFLNGFILKIAALVFMTLDHLSNAMYVMYPYGESVAITNFYYIGKSLGRLALPLFIFLLVEGVRHTKDKNKYLLRLGIEALFISLVLLICFYLPINGVRQLTANGNIFLDLFLGALTLFLLQSKTEWKRYMGLPILLFAVGSFIVKCYEYSTGATIFWFPHFLRMQYDWLSIVLAIGFYFSYDLTKTYFDYQEKYTGVSSESWKETSQWRLAENLFSIGFLVIGILIYYLVAKLLPQYAFYNGNVSTFAMLAGLFILFYNGKRGYNKKWFQYGCYIYYPLHLLIIIGILAIIWLR